MLRMWEVLSVIQDLPRPRQAEILDLVYDRLDTKVERDQLVLFRLDDKEIRDIWLKTADERETDLTEVTRLSVIFSMLQALSDLQEYSLHLPLQQVVDNYLFNQTYYTERALAYKLVVEGSDVYKTLTRLGIPGLVQNVIAYAIERDDVDVIVEVIKYLNTLDDEEILHLEQETIADLIESLKDNESSRLVLTWLRDHEDERGSESTAEDILQVTRDVPRLITLLSMIGERIENHVAFVADEHPDLFVQFVLELVKNGVDMQRIITDLQQTDDESYITVNEIANDQV